MLTKKQEQEIKILKFFSKENFDYSDVEEFFGEDISKERKYIQCITKSDNGVSPEEAFFTIMKGAPEVVTTDKKQLLSYLDTKRNMARIIEVFETHLLNGRYSYDDILHTNLRYKKNKILSFVFGRQIQKIIKPNPVPAYVMQFFVDNLFVRTKGEIIFQVYENCIKRYKIKKIKPNTKKYCVSQYKVVQ